MKYFLSLILTFAISFFSYPQTNKYFDAPFGGGGGFIACWQIPNVDQLNVKLKEVGIPEFSTSGLFTTGGAGFLYIGFVKNLRIGGMGFGGSTSKTSSVNNINQEAIYSIGGGGITVEYTLPFIKNIGVSIGGTLAAGSMNIELYHNDGKFSWNNIWNEIDNGSTTNVSRKIENNFWIFSPTLNMEVPFYRFLAFRLGVGYQLSFGNSWKTENGQSITGIPSDLKSDGFFIQAGILAGFFAF
ncbi:MAG TPA: hypothetical protein PK073_08370 [Ignavibacteriaceae bacterium]|jgi:hypothetical protein|nr:MAG: hypothetical protein BWY38_02958 [Ignavibacteria bacterium ADurb.Bin266]OQY71265.1 MAG: hypothetical protein B6D44_13320 [Ignavibacteriales bacterium UTCHB2]HQF42916.1 hypothetical protein [Ignavibacteriaceae bacterium]HQI42326.1 hypothetical protein [Ignavibacteriaceae bacterium]HQJ45892.1 hypothetical protein [Ignavibacteriaceae bacterium]